MIVHFVFDSVRKLFDTSSYATTLTGLWNLVTIVFHKIQLNFIYGRYLLLKRRQWTLTTCCTAVASRNISFKEELFPPEARTGWPDTWDWLYMEGSASNRSTATDLWRVNCGRFDCCCCFCCWVLLCNAAAKVCPGMTLLRRKSYATIPGCEISGSSGGAATPRRGFKVGRWMDGMTRPLLYCSWGNLEWSYVFRFRSYPYPCGRLLVTNSEVVAAVYPYLAKF
jgi:hypothetical protein